MVITVTLNPAMDKTMNVDNFTPGEVNRAAGIRYDIGGKGINVSKVLKNLGVESVSTGFLGGIWENTFMEELAARNISADFVHIHGNTRTNTKIVDEVNKVFTDVNEPGPDITDCELENIINKFSEICKKGDMVVFSGGVSPSVPNHIYKTLIEIAKKNEAFVILDAEGELLSEGLKAIPNVIKPNEFELSRLLGIESNNRNEIIKKALQLKNNGIERIMISLGSKGAIYITDEGIYFADALKVQVRGTVGAGDSMVAGLIYSMINKLNSADTLKFATACGGATVSLNGTEACTLSQVQALISKVKVEKIQEEQFND